MAANPLSALLDLVLPRECGCCRAPGVTLCQRCRGDLSAGPIRLAPRVDPGVPCWALGDYSAARRAAVLAAKERDRRDMCAPIGVALARAIGRLRAAGEIDERALSPVVLIPAPGRAAAARRRGGDPVLAMCRSTARGLAGPPVERVGRAGPTVTVAPVLSVDPGVRDSVGLNAAARRRNLAGRIRVDRRTATRMIAPLSDRSARLEPTIIVIDDVLTTGATITESVAALRLSRIDVTMALVVASGANPARDRDRSIPSTPW